MEKQRWEEPEKRRAEERRSEKRKSGKKMQVREKVGKSRKHGVFPMICGSGGSTSRLAKAAGAEPSGQMRNEKLHAVVARSTFANGKKNTSHSGRFWKLSCRKSAHRVARSTFPSQNVQNTPCSDHFGKLTCRKSARRCGTKHISKAKCTKHTMLAPLLEVDRHVEKVHAVVARSAFRAKMLKHHMFAPLLDVEM